MESPKEHLSLISHIFFSPGRIISLTCLDLACLPEPVMTDPCTHHFHGSERDKGFAALITVVTNITIVMLIDGKSLLKIDSCMINSYM